MPHSEQFVRHQVPVRADYIAQLQAEMVRELPARSRREKDAFTALDVHEQAWRFMNWQSRRVHPHPRQINKANGFDDLPAMQANRPGVEALLASLARGDEANAHLSDLVMQGYCLHRAGQGARSCFTSSSAEASRSSWLLHHTVHGPAGGSLRSLCSHGQTRDCSWLSMCFQDGTRPKTSTRGCARLG